MKEKQHHRMGRGWLVLVAVLSVFSLIAAACGDDDDDASSASASEPAEAPAEAPAEEPAEAPAEEPAEEPAPEPEPEPKDPIKVMVITPEDNDILIIPEARIGVQAAAERINSEGGVQGHPIEVLTCNDQNDPNTAASCAREAVDAGVVAVVGG